jgi:hypothetical protein
VSSIKAVVLGTAALGLGFVLVLALVVGAALSAASASTPGGSGPSGTLNTNAIPAGSQSLIPYLEEAGTLCPQIGAPLLAAQITQESSWNSSAVSPSNAEGISQFLASTFPSWSQPPATTGPDTPFNAPDAILAQGRFMCALAAQMLPLSKSSGVSDVSLALASYNAGSAAVVAAGGMPQNGQTPNYVARILAGQATFTLATTTSASGDAFGLRVADFA